MTTLVDILAREGIEFRRRPHDGKNRARCPRCDKGSRDDALGVRIYGERAAFWECYRCEWSGSVKNHEARSVSAPVARPPAKRAHADARGAAVAIWRDSKPLLGTLGEAYLQRRGCVLPPADGDVRFAQTLYCSQVERRLPALVARVSTVDGNRGVGVHRIFLDPNGGDRAVAKMRLAGAEEAVCIRLWPDDQVTVAIGIAEGVETALSAARLFAPMWSTIDAGQLERFPVMAGIDDLVIFADNDERGLDAAATCGARWLDSGRNVQTITTAVRGDDINDLVRESRESACAP